MQFSSLNDLKKKAEEEKKQNEYYVGGTDNRGGGSGLSVEAPPPNNRGPQGQSEMLSRIVENASAPDSGEGGPVPHLCQVTLYANGFVVDDGDFRSYDLPESQTFMRALLGGNVPTELAATGDVTVSLNDKRGETFTPPPYSAFGGEAQSLGSSSSTPSEVFSADTIPDGTPTVDEAAPSTTIQIRLANGKRLKVKLNTSMKVVDVLRLIKSEGGATAPFTISAGFPPKQIVDINLTIEECGLKGSAVTQKLA